MKLRLISVALVVAVISEKVKPPLLVAGLYRAGYVSRITFYISTMRYSLSELVLYQLVLLNFSINVYNI